VHGHACEMSANEALVAELPAPGWNTLAATGLVLLQWLQSLRVILPLMALGLPACRVVPLGADRAGGLGGVPRKVLAGRERPYWAPSPLRSVHWPASPCSAVGGCLFGAVPTPGFKAGKPTAC